jgi:alginate O-acetyltransferase complex protein AlgI
MLLGGLWHGAAWTFVWWGGLHGAFLVINHFWIKFKQQFQYQVGRTGRLCSSALTFISVTIAWVFFRADSAATALSILKSMAGFNGFALPEKFLVKFGPVAGQLEQWGVNFRDMYYFKGSNEFVYITIALLMVWFAPNVQQMMSHYEPCLNIMGKGDALPEAPAWLKWQPSLRWALVFVACGLASILLLSKASEFIYFQF